MEFLNSILFIIILSLTINQFALHLPSVAATDVLSHGDELNSLESNSTLVSANGKFTLGFFFTLFDTYLGIWYNDSDERKVWVANRDIPMTNVPWNGKLIIDDSGTLKVISGDTTLFNVSNEVGSGNTTRAVLKDSGNLVVYDVKSNRTLWQSFDHPTDTLLPGMKLGYNLTTGENWTLTSWLTDQIPASGAFTLRLERIQNLPQLVIYRRGKVYWSSGWDGNEFPSINMPRLREIVVSDGSGMYIAIDTVGISIAMLQLSYLGELIDATKIPVSPSSCYGYQLNYDGCAPSSFSNCRDPSYTRIQVESGFWDGDYIQIDNNANISLSDCMERCWNDCNCYGVSTSGGDGTGCFFWGGEGHFSLDQTSTIKIGVVISQKTLKDVLSHGDKMNSLGFNSTLVSANGKFTLGFFTLLDTYLGIWYNDNDERKVWVANLDIPITTSNGKLIIDDSGTLKVISGDTTLFNVSNEVGSGNTTRAVLKDSGNLVLYDVKSNLTLWQSFDHPTDTLLPGMKLGYNLTTGQNWTLTSWLTDRIPAPGAFTLRLEPDQNSDPLLVIYRRGMVYWSSGWDDNEFPTINMHKLREILVYDGSGMYIAIDTDGISIAMLQLSYLGELIDGTEIPVSPSSCYGINQLNYDGCAPSSFPNCRDPIYTQIQVESGYWDGDYIQYDNNANISLSDCMERCWNDCNCNGVSTSVDDGTGCYFWGGEGHFSLDQTSTIKIGVLQNTLKDELSRGNQLDTNSTLVSAGGNFTLGFFTLQNFTYLGIWYTDDQDTKVWVANRDMPMTMTGGGSLKDSAGYNSWWQISSLNTTAVLKDSGNLVLYPFGTRDWILWQSFDHPTNTLLPGMKLGYNLTTGQNWTLTSWLTDQIPASGAFTLRLERIKNSPQLVIYRRGKVYWSSGLHSSNSTFGSGILVSDASGMYFTIQNISGKSMLQLSSIGALIDGGNNLLTPSLCYGYQSHDGCAISSLPNCRGQRDSFQLKSGIWDGDLIHNENSSNISLSDCMEICWKDCNCKGFSTNESNGTGCFTWGKDALFSSNTSTSTQSGVLISLKPPKKKTWIWILVSVAVLLSSALATYLCYRHRLQEKQNKRRDDYIHQLTGSASFNYGDELEKNIKDAPDVKIFSLKAILTATDNFSNENKLGQGGYGPVYKGKLFDGRQIAVKRLSKTSGQGIEEFKNELILISKVQHTNLVRLYGCCIHQEEKMLIYEFMPNKSLDFFLFGAEDQKEKINWQMRFNIIEGVAQGLLYLHKYSRMKVIHRDLKVSNVLLDDNMNPKIADFGMARIFQQNVTEAITNRVVGTYGYMAPEYAMRGTFSIKSDVYSFGVLILEIVSGKRNSNFYSLNRALNLLGYAWELWKGHASLELKDESLGESYDLKQLLRIIHVGLLCVQENANDRPHMPAVISMLNNEITDLPIPKQPAFLTSTPLVEAADQNIPGSVNDLTITMMEAR